MEYKEFLIYLTNVLSILSILSIVSVVLLKYSHFYILVRIFLNVFFSLLTSHYNEKL